MRTSGCEVGYLCFSVQWGADFQYNSNEYREVMTKEDQCKLKLNGWGSATEKMKKEYYEYCPKSKSNNIIFCPKRIIKTLDKKKEKKVQLINDYFKNLGRKCKKKKNRKKGKERTKKNKKTKRKKRKIKRKKKKIERKKKKIKRKKKKTKRKRKKTKRKMSQNFN